MATQNKDTLQSLLSGEPIPQFPFAQKEWDLPRYQKEIETFHRKLMNYLRRLIGRLTSVTIIQGVIQEGVDVTYLTAWRYDSATNKFQVKTQACKVLSKSTESAWTDVSDGVQPTSVTALNNWHYDTSSHKFQIKTQQFYALAPAAVSSYGNTADGQPVTITQVQRDTTYSTVSHVLAKDTVADVYVLEKGANTSGTNIDTAVPCS